MTQFVEEYANGFEAVRKAQEMVQNYLPIFKCLDEYRISGEPFSVMEIGEKMMPNGGYHAKVPAYYGRDMRSWEAQSMTGRIASALRSLVKEGLVTYTEIKDMDHPHMVEFNGTYYTDERGNVLPDAVTVTAPDGGTYEVATMYLRGVRTCRGRIQKPVYKSYRQYRFVG